MDAEQVKEQVGQYLTQGGYYNANKQLYFMFTKVSGSAVLDTLPHGCLFFSLSLSLRQDWFSLVMIFRFVEFESSECIHLKKKNIYMEIRSVNG